VWFLSDPSLSDDDFQALAHILRDGGGHDIVTTAATVREAVRKKDWADVKKRLRATHREEHTGDPLLDSVSRLLLSEANLTVSAALRALAEVLGYNIPMVQSLSLQNGIKRLRKQFEPGEIVSAAQRVRNQVVHNVQDSPNMTWPLKKHNNDRD